MEKPVPEEATERKRVIRNSAGLAKALGFTRNQKEKERWYREYWKPVDSGGYLTLAFQDGKLIRSGERIIIGVKRSEVSPGNDKEFDLCQDAVFAESIEKLGLSKNEARMFIKSELKNGGYLKLYYFLLDLLRKLEEEINPKSSG